MLWLKKQRKLEKQRNEGSKMLYLIGLGLDVGDISLRHLSLIKKCKNVYLENYTIEFPYKVNELEKAIKHNVILADRKMIENDAEKIILEAKAEDVALLVYGDPFSATTHSDLVMRARKMKIEVGILHNSSVVNAVSDTGLQIYKFGKIASIPKWQASFRPESFYDTLKENQAIKAHTLFLVDIGLNASEALSYIKDIASRRKEDISSLIFVVCSRLGTENSEIHKGDIDEMMAKKFAKPVCIIVPSTMHFMEAEMLESVSK
jgi:diphthine synthase